MSSTAAAAVPFSELGLSETVLRAVKAIGYESASPIQAATIPAMLEGADILGQAATGTGKTAAFALPILSKIDTKKREPQALVLAPTSVVANWQAELARFAPELEVRVYRGAERRSRLEALAPATVLVTSYELLLRDRAHFEELAFATLVVDEAQTLKNARTLRARAVHGLSAAFRIALSGTLTDDDEIQWRFHQAWCDRRAAA